MYFLFGCRGAKRFYFFILSTRFTDHYHTCRAGTIVFLAYIHGAKVHVFRLRHPNHPIILRNSLIIIVRYMMAQKSDEVRRIFYLKPRLLIQPQNSRMKSPNQTEIAYQLSNLGSICTRLMSNLRIFVVVKQKR